MNRAFISLLNALLALCLLATCGAQWTVASAADGVRLQRITKQEVRQAVATEFDVRHLPAELHPAADEIELPVAVPASPGHALRVSSVCWDGDSSRLRFRLICGEPGECVPFLAYLPTPAFERRESAARFAFDPEPSQHAGAASCTLGGERNSTRTPKATLLVRPGQVTEAVTGKSGLRVTAKVICLDRGTLGDVVRVRGEDGAVFRARVGVLAQLEPLD